MISGFIGVEVIVFVVNFCLCVLYEMFGFCLKFDKFVFELYLWLDVVILYE